MQRVFFSAPGARMSEKKATPVTSSTVGVIIAAPPQLTTKEVGGVGGVK